MNDYYSQCLYRRLLEENWHHLPKVIREMHELGGDGVATGFAKVERGEGFLSRLLAGVFGFPSAGQNIPVSVRFIVDNHKEIWQRDFDGKIFSSDQYEGAGRYDGLLCERFGPFVFGIELVFDGRKLHLILKNLSLWNIPLPRIVAPKVVSYETENSSGHFTFFVEIAHAFTGLVVRYQGWLVPKK